MSEEEKIKQFEKEQLNKLLIELKDIDNFKFFRNGSFKYDIGKYQAGLLLNHIDNLQQENEHNKYILTEFERWLETTLIIEKAQQTDKMYVKGFQECLDKLQELKEGKK